MRGVQVLVAAKVQDSSLSPIPGCSMFCFDSQCIPKSGTTVTSGSTFTARRGRHSPVLTPLWRSTSGSWQPWSGFPKTCSLQFGCISKSLKAPMHWREAESDSAASLSPWDMKAASLALCRGRPGYTAVGWAFSTLSWVWLPVATGLPVQGTVSPAFLSAGDLGALSEVRGHTMGRNTEGCQIRQQNIECDS